MEYTELSEALSITVEEPWYFGRSEEGGGSKSLNRVISSLDYLRII